MELVSVIIPTYNRCDLLMDRAIPSVLAQSGDWECHVVGDGTDDATCRAMGALCRLDRRFRFTNRPRQRYPEGSRWDHWGLLGLDALNYGLDTAAPGSWIAVLNDDDEFAPDHHRMLLDTAGDAEFVYGRSVTPWDQWYGAWPPGDGQLTQGSYIYRGRAKAYRYDPDCLSRGLNGDADMWTRMYNDGIRFRMVPELVHRYYPSRQREAA